MTRTRGPCSRWSPVGSTSACALGYWRRREAIRSRSWSCRGENARRAAGGFEPQGGPVLSGRIEQSFRDRLAALPPSTRLLLLVAAAESVGIHRWSGVQPSGSRSGGRGGTRD